MALGNAVGDGRVAILPPASASEGDHVFDRWGRMGLDHYRDDGVLASIVPIKTRADAHPHDLVPSVERAAIAFFSGGKPSRLAEVLRDAPLLAAIRRALDRGAVSARCSAGAMV